MRSLKIPNNEQIVKQLNPSEQRGNYSLPNSFVQLEKKRGSLEFGLDVLRRWYKVECKEAIPFNKMYDFTNCADFCDVDLANVNAASPNPIYYIFYGDVILSTWDNPNGTVDESVDVWFPKDLKDKSAGNYYAASAYSAAGGLGQCKTQTFNNMFAYNLVITDAASGAGGPSNYRNIAKFEGWVLRVF